MNKLKAKQIFWRIVHHIEDRTGIAMSTDAEVVTERGISLSDNRKAMYRLDDGVIRVYDDKGFPLMAIMEDSEMLWVLKEVFGDMKWGSSASELDAESVFWKVVSHIEFHATINFKNFAGVVTQRGISVANGYSVMFGLDDGVIRIHDNRRFPIMAITKDDVCLLILKEIFEDMDWGIIND